MKQSHINLVYAEMTKAKAKFPTWSIDNIHRASNVMEEAGEMVREVNLLHEGRGSIENLRIEIIQMIGTGFRFLEELDKDERAKYYTNNL